VAETANQDEHKAILGFNVDLLANAETELENADVKLFTDEVIYQLIEDYETYVEEKQRAQQETVLDKVVRPRGSASSPTTRSARTTRGRRRRGHLRHGSEQPQRRILRG